MFEEEIIPQISSFSEIEVEWKLMEKALSPEYFQSFSWQQLWHKTMQAKGFHPLVLGLCAKDKIHLLSSIIVEKKRTLALFKQETAYFNCCGSEEFDVICPEFCNPLISKEAPQDSFGRMLDHLVSHLNVKQVFINAVPIDTMHELQQSCQGRGVHFTIESRSAHHWIDLDQLRSSGREHLSSINSRARSTIRKTIEKYENQFGKVKLRPAESSTVAKEWFDKLIELNLHRFKSKGKTSSFCFPFLKDYHDDLIEHAFPKGEVVMVRLEAGDRIIGYIYGFQYNKVISIYQTGFVFEEDNKLSPGMVAHHLFVQESLSNGISRYDFLAGDYQYKRVLSNEHSELVWIRISKPNFISSVENILKKLKRKIVKVMGRNGSCAQ